MGALRAFGTNHFFLPDVGFGGAIFGTSGGASNLARILTDSGSRSPRMHIRNSGYRSPPFRDWPSTRVVEHYSPPIGFTKLQNLRFP